jgi:hypothetical protein
MTLMLIIRFLWREAQKRVDFWRGNGGFVLSLRIARGWD